LLDFSAKQFRDGLRDQAFNPASNKNAMEIPVPGIRMEAEVAYMQE
jgi:hypothetical protein